MARQLTMRQARNCETAQGHVCKCRCGGKLHGINRAGSLNPPDSFFFELPADDPHHQMTEEEKKEDRNRRRREAYAKTQAAHAELAKQQRAAQAEAAERALEAAGQLRLL